MLILVDLAEPACARILRVLILHGKKKTRKQRNVVVFRNQMAAQVPFHRDLEVGPEWAWAP